ncbi:lytic transglycosylase [Geomonas sp. RF6]|uniref:lytic transglycosylase n=1 Tax=Geomonas sp. RF6 TaxID=2897342 RepID=UPI002EDB290B
MLVAVVFSTTSCDQSHLQQAHAPAAPISPVLVRELQALPGPAETTPLPAAVEQKAQPKDLALEERKKQVSAISAAFARRTTPRRARWLAELCYQKTEGTLLTPMDLAEIALAETGGHKLSSRAVSSRGALGVWQLMPDRAISHGFRPHEMRDDEKCAEAAVRELYVKLRDAKGNLNRAKRLYCGSGPAARVYEVKRRLFRQELLRELDDIKVRHEMVREMQEAGGMDLAPRG